jgi:hypothetical protein
MTEKGVKLIWKKFSFCEHFPWMHFSAKGHGAVPLIAQAELPHQQRR